MADHGVHQSVKHQRQVHQLRRLLRQAGCELDAAANQVQEALLRWHQECS
jgi:hypothetical protein